ncbi:hypothetical protein ATG98_0135 [Marinobacter sp. LV10R520-4]|nr:hypothetical protein ATG98_0135 [Marinobacter sp. LV10R520-4]
MTDVKQNTDWLYERGEGRYKHRWNNDYAGFEPSDNGSVGKCPSSITETLATEILNQGVPYYSGLEDQLPSKIYSVHQGVIYEAVPTMPGVSWHGYPWRGNLRGRRPLSSRIVRKLKKMAEKSGHSKEFEQWLKQYG